jgi:omega-amidase
MSQPATERPFLDVHVYPFVVRRSEASMKITISLGQLDVRAGEPEHNLARVREWIAESARRGADIAVFPELWDTGYALDRAAELGSPLGEGRFAEVADLAGKHRIHVIGSMLEAMPPLPSEPSTRRAYNTAVWFGPDGRQGVYRKLHLFRLMEEDRFLLPGDDPLCLSFPWGRTGVAICYDLRFPELFRGYALAGAAMVIVPAQWPYPRLEHWRTLLRARAIENQMIVVGCNRVGRDGDTRFCGHSAIIDAWGEVVVEGGDREILLTAALDLSAVTDAREKIPVFEDRRPEVYG